MSGSTRSISTNGQVASGSHSSDDGVSVTVTKDSERHSVTGINGDTVSFKLQRNDDSRVTGSWPSEADEHVREIISNAINEREQRENKRANHRNLNRLLTLLGALVIGLAVTFVLNSGVLGAVGVALSPYAFSITILMDSGLAVYGFIKHY
jgi:hypothetical protein